MYPSPTPAPAATSTAPCLDALLRADAACLRNLLPLQKRGPSRLGVLRLQFL